ncbi:MAG: type IV pilus modification protein PilV [Deltaproteobacteria bacterium]|nr:type IV pilus modification protein PilV [Deltaproteobacteria bacterium]
MRLTLIHHKVEQGFSLIEVLVTLLVVSVGLLGVVAMQLTALRNTHSAFIHSQATVYVSDMAERILANSVIAQAGQYNIGHGQQAPGSADCVAEACSATDLANYDVFEWQQVLSMNLPSGGGEISLAGTTLTVTVRWDDDRDGDKGTLCPPESADLDCVQVLVNL